MASIHRDKKSGIYRVHFRCLGRQYLRSLKTKNLREARGSLGRIDETLRLIERGRLEVPIDVDPADFVLSDGKKTSPKQEVVEQRIRLSELITAYEGGLPEGAKESSTRDGENLHFKHLRRHFGTTTIVQAITLIDVQNYVEKRLQDKYRGKPISVDTIKKELATFRMLWNWALAQERLQKPCPTKGVKYPKRDAKPPFMTWDDIDRIIGRGGLSEDETDELWSCLFLGCDEIGELLQAVRDRARAPFIYPMFLFAAHTGARRSEIIRSRIDDFDFALRVVHIREKKRSRTQSTTFRRVPMSQRLAEEMSTWFAEHPGGQMTICREDLSFSTTDATNHFRLALRSTRWEGKVKGFHTLRHSFASNAAAAGVDPGMIDSWMGHQTEEMRNRYRHLFPRQQQTAIDLLFGESS